MSPIKEALADNYLVYINDFVSFKSFAEYLDITDLEALIIIELGRKYHEERVTTNT